jgi:uncharacterized membrane protein (DUF485 family)
MWSGLGLLAASEARSAIQRQLRAAVLMLAAGTLLMGAMAFALVALHEWLSMRMSPIAASLWIAAGLTLVAALLIFAAMYVRRAKRRMSPMASTALVTAPAVARAAVNRLSFRTLGLIGVLVLGAFAGRKLSAMGSSDDES